MGRTRLIDAWSKTKEEGGLFNLLSVVTHEKAAKMFFTAALQVISNYCSDSVITLSQRVKESSSTPIEFIEECKDEYDVLCAENWETKMNELVR